MRCTLFLAMLLGCDTTTPPLASADTASPTSDTGEAAWSAPDCGEPADQIFAFGSFQRLGIPPLPGARHDVLVGDANGDGWADVIHNTRLAGVGANEVLTYLGRGDGGFDPTPLRSVADVPAPSEGWDAYEVYVADVDDDGQDDLVFNYLEAKNVVYVAHAQANDWAWKPRAVHEVEGDWLPYSTHVVDMNGDGRDDVVWNRASWGNLTFFAFGQADGTLVPTPLIAPIGSSAEVWDRGLFKVLADLDGDGASGFVWSSPRHDGNTGRQAQFEEGTLVEGPTPNRTGIGWGDYVALAGDFDGIPGSELAWVAPQRAQIAIHSSRWESDGPVDRPLVIPPFPGAPYDLQVADFNGDSRDDVLFLLGQTNHVDLGLALGTDSAFEVASDELQRHAASPRTCQWEQFEPTPADVNGDGLADLVWVSDTEVLVAISCL